jgi:putative Mg2+ transporter-C (MgtC) family protein
MDLANIDWSWLNSINEWSVIVRMLLAIVLGGMIGLERGANRHQAGLRTHILVCVGATIVMMTNQFIVETFDTVSDPARLGAQVITGVGFLGAGLIMVTSRNKVKGLTTAAGLWACACLGLAIGIGFYSGAITAAVIVLIVLGLLPRFEDFVYDRARTMLISVDLQSAEAFPRLLTQLRDMKVIIRNTNISRNTSPSPHGYSLDLNIILPKGMHQTQLVEKLSLMDGVLMVGEQE